MPSTIRTIKIPAVAFDDPPCAQCGCSDPGDRYCKPCQIKRARFALTDTNRDTVRMTFLASLMVRDSLAAARIAYAIVKGHQVAPVITSWGPDGEKVRNPPRCAPLLSDGGPDARLFVTLEIDGMKYGARAERGAWEHAPYDWSHQRIS